MYSNIKTYNSSQEENPIQYPPIYVGIPSVFQQVGKIPKVINKVDEKKVKL